MFNYRDLNLGDLNVLNVLRHSKVHLSSLRLGDTGLLQPQHANLGLGFSSAVDDDLSQEEDEWQEKSN